MKNETIVKLAVAAILAPTVINGAIALTNVGITIYNGIQENRFKRKMKKGIENGSIIEYDGKYYELEVLKREAKLHLDYI